MHRFARAIVRWQPRYGRRGMPWQGARDPYRVWLSEIMLQQTQVDAATPYYERFVARFPDVGALARASEDEVLRLWSGLGYYARARNLRTAARRLVAERGGRFPRQPEALARLPGVGRSTAAAIAVFAFGRRAAILDGNVRRVLARHFGVAGDPGEAAVRDRLWRLAERLVPERQVRIYTQGLMDLGATVCRRARPLCGCCPVAASCVARREARLAELPGARRRKTLPLRRANWLVALRDGKILLERRPSRGLWGGLWTFPEACGTGARAIGRTLGGEIAALRRLPPVEHGFTHFRLRAQPLLCELRPGGPRAAAGARRWFGVAEAIDAAVPVPVRALLRSMRGAR
jgi:A/G-specific adenine glycosylase